LRSRAEGQCRAADREFELPLSDAGLDVIDRGERRRHPQVRVRIAEEFEIGPSSDRREGEL
jgi:hypothetical protein